MRPLLTLPFCWLFKKTIEIEKENKTLCQRKRNENEKE